MRLPGWFKALFVVMMLIVCGTVTWWAVTQYDLHTQAAELALKLDTSRQRERKQQVEYDEVVAALPVAQESLEALRPQADEASAREAELREQRKALRAEVAALEERVAGLSVPEEALSEALTALDALTEQAAALEEALADMCREQATIESLLTWQAGE